MEKLDFYELLQEVQTPDGPQDLTEEQRSVFAAALLIAYGKRKNPAGGVTPAGN